MEYPKALYRSKVTFQDGNLLAQALKDRVVEHAVVSSAEEEVSWRSMGYGNFVELLQTEKPSEISQVEITQPEAIKAVADAPKRKPGRPARPKEEVA